MKTYIYIIISLISLEVNAQCFQSFSSGAGHAIMIKNDSTLWAWGQNTSDAVGICNGSIDVFNPIQLSNQPIWSKIFALSNRTFVIKSDGTLWACGSGLGGSLGTGNQNNVCSLTQIGTANDWSEIYSGQGTIAKKNDGTLWGWGSNIYGQLNLGTNSLEFIPVQISTETNWIKINIAYHTLALKTNGTIWACGLNDKGQIGDGTQTNKLNFVQVGSDANWVDIASGYLDKNSFALKSDGTFWGWGENVNMLFGNGGHLLQPTQLGNDNDWNKLTGVNQGVILIKTNGTLWSFTNNFFQQIGTESNWVNIYGGWAHFFAMKSDSTLWCLGSNNNGQLGLGNSITNATVMTQLNCSAFLGIEEVNPLSKIKIYPNPTNEILFIENNSYNTIDKITLIDITGKIVLEIKENLSKINMGNLESGFYILNISSENRIYNYKIVKK